MAQFDTTTETMRGRAESMVSDVKEKGQEAATAVRKKGQEAASAFTDVADTFGDALDDSLRRRPYATLAVAAGIGFLFGAAWSR